MTFVTTLFLDLLDFFFNDFAIYRRISRSYWSLIECKACPQPFWTRGIPKPAPHFTVAAIQVPNGAVLKCHTNTIPVSA